MASKTKSEEVGENKKHFKDLISKLNEITDKVSEAEVALEKFSGKLPSDMLVSTPVLEPIVQKLTEGTHSHQEMRNILSRFNIMFEENIKPVLLEETATGEYDLAIKTKATSAGVQIGHWEIKKFTEGKEVIYGIDNVDTKVTILEDIRTYAAASAIVKLLNAGMAANSRDVSSFLELDESFRIHYQDALTHKRKFLKTKNPIYEDRFEFCKDKALTLKETITKKSKEIM